MAIPLVPVLSGAVLYEQVVALELGAGGPIATVSATNTLRLTLGNCCGGSGSPGVLVSRATAMRLASSGGPLLAWAAKPGRLSALMTDAPRVLHERRGDIVLATLNAPERRNAIDQQMVDGLHRLLDQYWHDESIAALVLTGAGDKAFAAGADIAQLRERTSLDALKAINSGIFNRIEEFPAPVIAAIKGFALGGGCELAIACDLRVLGESAKLGQPEVKLGIIPAAGGTYRLPRLVGLGLARELVYTGRMVDAAEALRIGLANAVVPDADVLPRALLMAEEIAQNGRLAVRGAKRALNALSRPGHENAIGFESSVQAVLFDSDDKKARMDAFLQKQKKA